MRTLDITSFEKALNSLKEVIEVYNSDKTNLIIRDSMIQRFEYTYSIALKMIKRFFSQGAFVLENIIVNYRRLFYASYKSTYASVWY